MLYPIKVCHSSKTGWEPLHHYHIGLYSEGSYTVWEVGITINLSNKLSYYISLPGVPGGRGLHFLGLSYWFIGSIAPDKLSQEQLKYLK